ncbi:MAG: YdcF family protein [Janthinobacterium lividum]
MPAKRKTSWLTGAKYGVGAFVAWVLLHMLLSTLDGLRDQGQRADVGVILGNKVNEDGTLSERLRQRLGCGLRLYRQGCVRRLLVSGGLGKEGFAEGSKMRDYLRAQGVPDSVITVDNKGNTTRQTARNAWRLKNELRVKSVLVVSQFYHLTRTKMLFRQVGFEQVSGVSPRYSEWRDAYSLLREFGAYYTELLF